MEYMGILFWFWAKPYSIYVREMVAGFLDFVVGLRLWVPKLVAWSLRSRAFDAGSETGERSFRNSLDILPGLLELHFHSRIDDSTLTY